MKVFRKFKKKQIFQNLIFLTLGLGLEFKFLVLVTSLDYALSQSLSSGLNFQT